MRTSASRHSMSHPPNSDARGGAVMREHRDPITPAQSHSGRGRASEAELNDQTAWPRWISEAAEFAHAYPGPDPPSLYRVTSPEHAAIVTDATEILMPALSPTKWRRQLVKFPRQRAIRAVWRRHRRDRDRHATMEVDASTTCSWQAPGPRAPARPVEPSHPLL